MLKRLAADGHVTGRRVAQTDRPDKRILSLTEAGMATLRDWLDHVEPIAAADHDGALLKVFFGAFGDPEAGRRQPLDFRGRAEERLATIARSSGPSTARTARRRCGGSDAAPRHGADAGAVGVDRRDARGARARHDRGGARP